MLDVYFAIPVLDENKYLFQDWIVLQNKNATVISMFYICINDPTRGGTMRIRIFAVSNQGC